MSTKTHIFGVLFCALLGIGLAACPGTLADPDAFRDAATREDAASDGSGKDEDAQAACPDVPSAVFSPKCAITGCHIASGQSPDLESPDPFTRLAGKSALGGPGVLFDPGGDPDKSVVYTKLLPRPPFGSRMPAGTALDDTTIACVATWIRARKGTVPADAASD